MIRNDVPYNLRVEYAVSSQQDKHQAPENDAVNPIDDATKSYASREMHGKEHHTGNHKRTHNKEDGIQGELAPAFHGSSHSLRGVLPLLW
jgi:hypothetical protein